MPKITVSGASLAYSETGEGEPLVLVHGSASDHRTWARQHEAFGGRFRTIVYSRRYHWPNEPIPEGADYSMPEQADDLAGVLRALDAAPAHLVGHSYGAFLCLLLAIREPALARSLVLAEPPVVPLFVSAPPRFLELVTLLLSRPRTAAAILKFGATGLGPATKAARRGGMEAAMRIFGTAVLGSAAYRALSHERREQVAANAIRAELLGSGFAPITGDQVRGVRVPTLLVTGRQSPALFHRLTDRLEELLPDVRRAEIDDASHIVHEDNPPAFNETVLSFLGGGPAEVHPSAM